MLRRLAVTFASLALVIGGLTGLELATVTPAHATTYYCGSYSYTTPSVTIYGMEGTTFCTSSGSNVKLVITCIAWGATSNPNNSTFDTNGNGGRACDNDDSGGTQRAFGNVHAGCNYYWTFSEIYLPAFHTYTENYYGPTLHC